jgi:hypothetical protein
MTTSHAKERVNATRDETVNETLKDRIKRLLAKRDLARARIDYLLPEFTEQQITNALQHLVSHAGGVVAKGTKNNRIYGLFRAPPVTEAKVVVPVHIKTLKRDPFELWKLCDRAPFTTADVPSLVR